MSERIEVVKILVRNQAGKFLTVKENDSGQWELPGGIIEEELGESRIDAAKRELKEEVNLRSSLFSDVVRVELEEFKEDEEIVNCWLMFTEDFKGEIELEERELTDFKWVKPEEYCKMDWHPDAGYGAPAMTYLEYYLD